MLACPPSMTISLATEAGAVLTGRSAAAVLRRRVEAAAGDGQVVLDFEGVAAVSPSFADELFAKLDPSLVDAGIVTFENLGPGVRHIADYVVKARRTLLS